MRNSQASPGPSSAWNSEDPVSLRGQMSTLKHEIRLKMAQFNALEFRLQVAPRPLPGEFSGPPPSPPSTSFSLPTSTPRRRNQNLPSHEEGIPMLGVANGPNGTTSKRSQSPTRSIHRIPVSAVSQARSLAENGGSPIPTVEEPAAINGASANGGNHSGLLDPPSPNSQHRKSLHTGNTTKVLADLQAGVVHARTALENTRSQLRLAQRSVAQLTRANEDLKDGRERLRLENESLNNVVARKERLLQEMLERARKAEDEAKELRAQLKSDSTNQKKALREMQITLKESTALSEKSQREYITLKDAVKGLQDGWQADVESLRSQLKGKEETWKKEIEDVNLKYRGLVKLTQAAQAERAKMEALKAESRALDAKFEDVFKDELRSLTESIGNSTKASDDASSTVQEMSSELARIRRLMRMGLRNSGIITVPPILQDTDLHTTTTTLEPDTLRTSPTGVGEG